MAEYLGVFRRVGFFNLFTRKEGATMSENRIKLAPDTVAYADGGSHKLVVEFSIPGAPTDTIDVKILKDSIHLTRRQGTSSMLRHWLSLGR